MHRPHQLHGQPLTSKANHSSAITEADMALTLPVPSDTTDLATQGGLTRRIKLYIGC